MSEKYATYLIFLREDISAFPFTMDDSLCFLKSQSNARMTLQSATKTSEDITCVLISSFLLRRVL